jgi:hypothetical protein
MCASQKEERFAYKPSSFVLIGLYFAVVVVTAIVGFPAFTGVPAAILVCAIANVVFSVLSGPVVLHPWL